MYQLTGHILSAQTQLCPCYDFEALLQRACGLRCARAVALQLVWAASILVALPVAVHRQWIPATHVELLDGAAAAGSLFAELFMIKSLLVFNPDAAAARQRAQRKRGADSDGALASPRSPASPRYERSMVPPAS